MRLRKQKKSICFFLIICMLFLGMCVENIHADSFLSYDKTVSTASTLHSAKGISLTSQVYPVETIARQDCITSVQQAVQRIFSRTARGIALNLVFVDILPQISPFILASSNFELPDETFSCAIIVNYIHHKDGKKA